MLAKYQNYTGIADLADLFDSPPEQEEYERTHAAPEARDVKKKRIEEDRKRIITEQIESQIKDCLLFFTALMCQGTLRQIPTLKGTLTKPLSCPNWYDPSGFSPHFPELFSGRDKAETRVREVWFN